MLQYKSLLIIVILLAFSLSSCRRGCSSCSESGGVCYQGSCNCYDGYIGVNCDTALNRRYAGTYIGTTTFLDGTKVTDTMRMLAADAPYNVSIRFASGGDSVRARVISPLEISILITASGSDTIMGTASFLHPYEWPNIDLNISLMKLQNGRIVELKDFSGSK